ncbi:MAG: indole-3-glycerol phosphate synthase TrpC [Chlamydiae bacterium]|nr:MAG: indole-3-glycerol phosphate synthase TrpC [Chlamydiota bacterium]
MNNILKIILETKLDEIAKLKLKGIPAERIDMPRGFISALTDKEPIGLIAEIKKASPSKGIIREDFNPSQLASDYERGGADCLSILTDKKYFSGDNENIHLARAVCSLPVLRKDFIIHPIQVEETYKIGADAILLIAAMLEQSQLNELYLQAHDFGLDVLVETHNEKEMEMAINCGTRLIGINNRNLNTFEVDLETTDRLSELTPKKSLLVSESGIFTFADIARVKSAGAKAVLVGESLMRQEDVSDAVRTLLSTS